LIDWHRYFSLLLQDHLSNSTYQVESEIDLSLKQQMLDVVIIRKGPGVLDRPMPDGMNDLTDFNLITFKSYQETFDDWTVQEFVGHYVNYRKQISPSLNKLLPKEQFKLFGVSARYPEKLASEFGHREIQAGVYEIQASLGLTMRLLVVNQLPLEEQNSLFHWFSAKADRVEYALNHYRKRDPDTSSLIDRLLVQYGKEGLNMTYTIKQFKKDLIDEIMGEPESREEINARLTLEEKLKDVDPREVMERFDPKDRIEGLDPKQRLEGLDPKQRLEGLDPKQRLEGLDPKQRLEGLDPKQRLEGLDPALIEAYLREKKQKSE
jgi:hypothetical protein